LWSISQTSNLLKSFEISDFVNKMIHFRLKVTNLEQLVVQGEAVESSICHDGSPESRDEDLLAIDSIEAFGTGLRLELQQSPDDEPDVTLSGKNDYSSFHFIQ